MIAAGTSPARGECIPDGSTSWKEGSGDRLGSQHQRLEASGRQAHNGHRTPWNASSSLKRTIVRGSLPTRFRSCSSCVTGVGVLPSRISPKRVHEATLYFDAREVVEIDHAHRLDADGNRAVVGQVGRRVVIARGRAGLHLPETIEEARHLVREERKSSDAMDGGMTVTCAFPTARSSEGTDSRVSASLLIVAGAPRA